MIFLLFNNNIGIYGLYLSLYYLRNSQNIKRSLLMAYNEKRKRFKCND